MIPRCRRAALVLVVIVLAGVLSTLTEGTTADAAECPDAGGAATSFEPDGDTSGDVILAGGGWGHGVGMSQYGAKGAALLGCSYRDILGTYYDGAAVGARDMPATVRVGLTDLPAQSGGGVSAVVTAEGGAVDWELDDCDESSAAACAVQPPVQPAGETWRIRSQRYSGSDEPSPSPSASPTPSEPEENAPADGMYVITDVSSGEEVWRGGDRFSLLTESHEDVIEVDVGGLSRRFKWGFTQLDSYAEGDGKLFVVHHITSAPDGSASGMERYLWGLAEVPVSWPTESLKAQVVAARSYAYQRSGLSSRETACRCDLYATTRDQHYQGWTQEEVDRSYGADWQAAVTATAGEVALYGDDVVDAFYSSSHGGWSESSLHVWGGDVPYLQAVDTSRWETAEGVNNPRQRWDVAYSADELADEFGLVAFDSIEVVLRGPGQHPSRVDDNGDGEPDGVRVTGTDANGARVTRWYSGEQLRSVLSLYSSLVYVHTAAADDDTAPDTTRACPPGEVPDAGFSDVPAGYVHGPTIDCVAWWEIAEGIDDERYAPLAEVPREQMASFIARAVEAAGYALPAQPEDHFADDDGSVHEQRINQLAEEGLVLGSVNETGTVVYRPREPVRRDQMATFLVRSYERVTDVEMTADEDFFADDDGNVHERRINKVATAAIATGTDERTYAPTKPVTRGQMASFLARWLNGLVESGQTSPPEA